MSQQLPCCMGYEVGKVPRGLSAWELKWNAERWQVQSAGVTEVAVLSWWQGAAAGQHRCEADKETSMLLLSGQF